MKGSRLGLVQPWAGNDNNIWIASTLTLMRNCARYRFPGKMAPDDAKHVRSLLSKELLGLKKLVEPSFYPADELGALEKEFLFEHFLSPRSFQDAISGEGFVIDTQGKTLAALNIHNHLQLHALDCSGEIEASWARLVALEREVSKPLPFAFTPRFGFLTSDPHQAGTALVASVFLHLPTLIHTQSIEEVVRRLDREEVEVTSLLGGIDEIPGDLLVLRNRCTIGLTEEDILHMIRANATKLLVEEKRLRTQATTDEASALKDKVSRAYGLLRHSYQIETLEAWDGLSLMKLGLDLDWVTGTTQQALNELLMTVRRAHLVSEFTGEVPKEELPHRRAELIHATLEETSLKI